MLLSWENKPNPILLHPYWSVVWLNKKRSMAKLSYWFYYICFCLVSGSFLSLGLLRVETRDSCVLLCSLFVLCNFAPGSMAWPGSINVSITSATTQLSCTLYHRKHCVHTLGTLSLSSRPWNPISVISSPMATERPFRDVLTKNIYQQLLTIM